MSKREYFTSIIGSIVLAHYYAILERWISWENLPEWMKSLPSFRGVNAYHYLFMFSLFMFIGGYPFLDDLFLHLTPRELKKTSVLIIGNIMLTVLVEDAAYFYLYQEWIKPGYWTLQICGGVKIGGIILPNWYFILIVGISLCYYYVFRKPKPRETKVKISKFLETLKS